MAELLVWPALIAYSEAAVAFAGELRGPGRAGPLGIWGVRIGWLAQTALLVAQGLTSDGFAWGAWAGALNLFVWLVVGAYLIWGCRPRFRLLGLGVMPIAVALLAVAWAGGGAGVTTRDEAGFLLGFHAGLMLAGFAGLTLAGGLAALYLWQERRLKRHDARLLSVRMPSLEALDRLSARAALVSLTVLFAGIAVGLASFERGDFDAAMVVTLGIWTLVATTLVLRREAALRGRRLAWLLLTAVALLVIVLPITHFAS
jgi:ABC-type uncharacterized transport system permease subunit